MSEKSLVNLLPSSIDNAAQNLTDPITKEIGGTIGDLWHLVFGGISQIAAKKRMRYAADLKQFEKTLAESIQSIPEESRIDPDIQLTAQALEASKYCVSSETLRQMFANLISGSMNSQIEPYTHPSFAEILKQMSPKDAIFLTEFKKSREVPIVSLGVTIGPDGYNLIYNNLLLKSNELSSKERTLAASALSKAGLVEMTTSQQFANEHIYSHFKEAPEYLQVDQLAQKEHFKVKQLNGICRITNLGSDFIKVCL